MSSYFTRLRQARKLKELLPEVQRLRRVAHGMSAAYDCSVGSLGEESVIFETGLDDLEKVLVVATHELLGLEDAIREKNVQGVKKELLSPTGIPQIVNISKQLHTRLSNYYEHGQSIVVGSPLEDAVLSVLVNGHNDDFERKPYDAFGASTQQEIQGLFREGQKVASFNPTRFMGEIRSLYEEIGAVFDESLPAWNVPDSMEFNPHLKPFARTSDEENAREVALLKRIVLEHDDWSAALPTLGKTRFSQGRKGRYIRFAPGQGGMVLLNAQPYREVSLNHIIGYDEQIQQVRNNIENLLDGRSANHMAIIGPPGTGKSSLANALFYAYRNKGLNVVSLSPEHIPNIPLSIPYLDAEKKYLFIADDFKVRDERLLNNMKSAIEGSFEGMPEHTRLCVITNETQSGIGFALEEDDALKRRFGLPIYMDYCSPDTALRIMRAKASGKNIVIDEYAEQRFLEVAEREKLTGSFVETYLNNQLPTKS